MEKFSEKFMGKLILYVDNTNRKRELFCRLAQVAKGMIAIGIFITHAIACYVAFDIIWREYLYKKVENSPKKLLWEYVLRTFMVFITCKSLYSSDFRLIHTFLL